MLLLAMALQASAPSLPGGADPAEPRTAVDAERAFAADAQALGQWTAFRKWAAVDATIFLPQKARALEAMASWADPPRAVRWSPAASFVSCDGQMAANTGPRSRPDGSGGYFSTVWVKQTGGWRWTVDGGDRLATPRVAVPRPAVRRAACTGTPPAQVPYPPGGPGATGFGVSRDGTLQWSYEVDGQGARVFRVALWDGRQLQPVIDDHVAVPPGATTP